ncbi:hypothetical protein KAH37_08495 [bacterium]|nr:hypothetical protein [bacterium]
MSKIIIDAESSIENLEVRLDHLLLREGDLASEVEEFQSLAPLVKNYRDGLPPLLISEGKLAEARDLLTGEDDLELLFLTVLADERPQITFDAIKKGIEQNGWSDHYQNLLSYLFVRADEAWSKEILLPLLLSIKTEERTPLILFLTVLHGDSSVPATGQSAEFRAARYLYALRIEKEGDAQNAFAVLLDLFESTGYPRFIYELLKIMLAVHDDIRPHDVERFVTAVVESPLKVPYAVVRFLEFLYHYKTGRDEKLSNSLTVLAESTESLFVLSALAPLLNKYEKWHLLSKFYKLSVAKLNGNQRLLYMKMLADLYDTKLEMPEFAIEIHKNIIEDDISAGFFSLSRVLTVYEESGQWEQLLTLYQYLADNEKDLRLQAHYSFRAGEVLYYELERAQDARVYLERSLESRHSFEAVRLLSEIYLKLSDYDAYIHALEKELEFQLDVTERIRVLDITADAYLLFKHDVISAEKYFLRILQQEPRHLQTVKKLGKLYYQTKSWRKLVEINKREYAISDNMHDRINLIYKNGVICFRELNDLDCAEENFTLILEQDKNHISSLLYLERIYMRNGNYDKLIQLYKKLADEGDELSETKKYYLTRLALILRERGELTSARDMFNRIVDSFPSDVLAREYVRILEGELSFSPVAFENEASSLELFDIARIMGQSTTPRGMDKVGDHFKDESFWFYLYQVFTGHKEDGAPSADETYLFLYQLLSKSFSIDTLVANSSRRVALIALLAGYIDRGYYPGVYTILTYYLKSGPTVKRQFWALFFRGLHRADLIERLESMLVDDQNQVSLEILVAMIEQLYEEKGDIKTILFLRSLYVKKESDVAKKIVAIDSTIEKFTHEVEARALLEFYRLRYSFSSLEEKRLFLPQYRTYLESLHMTDTLTKLYSALWENEHNPEDGAYLMSLYRSKNKRDEVALLAATLLETDPSNRVVLKELLELYNEKEAYDESLGLLQRQFPNEVPADKDIVSLWFDALIHSEKGSDIIGVFKRIEGDFDFYLFLIEGLIERKYPSHAERLLHHLETESVEHAIKKSELLLSLDVVLPDSLIAKAGGFFSLKDLFIRYMEGAAVRKTLRALAENGDNGAALFLFDMVLETGDVETASSLLELASEGNNPLVLQSKIYRVSHNTRKEAALLVEHIKDLVSGDWYPIKRLYDIALKHSPQVVYFLSSLLHDYDDKYSFNPDSWGKFVPQSRELITERAGMDERDLLVLELMRFLAFSQKTAVGHAAPLSSKNQRDIMKVFDHIKMIHEDVNIAGYCNSEDDASIITGVSGRVPVLIVSSALSDVSYDEASMRLLKVVALLKEGLGWSDDKNVISDAVVAIKEASSLRGRDRVAFVRSVREEYQSRTAAILSTVEQETRWDSLPDRIMTAATLHSFFLLPNPMILQRINGDEGYAFLDKETFSGNIVSLFLHHFVNQLPEQKSQ